MGRKLFQKSQFIRVDEQRFRCRSEELRRSLNKIIINIGKQSSLLRQEFGLIKQRMMFKISARNTLQNQYFPNIIIILQGVKKHEQRCSKFVLMVGEKLENHIHAYRDICVLNV